MRRILWLSVLGGIGAAGWKFWSSQQADGENDKGNWAPVPAGGSSAGAATSTQRFAADSSSKTSGAAARSNSDTSTGSASSDAGKSNAKGSDSSKANTAGGSGTASKSGKQLWVEPGPKGTCPADFPVKANQSSKIYHVPSGGSYARTKAERCYATPEDAAADGYRASKR